jgi:hypothetical protein
VAVAAVVVVVVVVVGGGGGGGVIIIVIYLWKYSKSANAAYSVHYRLTKCWRTKQPVLHLLFCLWQTLFDIWASDTITDSCKLYSSHRFIFLLHVVCSLYLQIVLFWKFLLWSDICVYICTVYTVVLYVYCSVIWIYNLSYGNLLI